MSETGTGNEKRRTLRKSSLDQVDAVEHGRATNCLKMKKSWSGYRTDDPTIENGCPD